MGLLDRIGASNAARYIRITEAQLDAARAQVERDLFAQVERRRRDYEAANWCGPFEGTMRAAFDVEVQELTSAANADLVEVNRRGAAKIAYFRGLLNESRARLGLPPVPGDTLDEVPSW